MELSQTQAEWRSRVDAFVREHVEPGAEEWDRNSLVPADTIRTLAREGYLGAALPAAEGGLGLDALSLGLLCQEMARGSASLASLLTVHSMCSQAVHRWGSEAQHGQWVPRLARGEAIGAFALSEPGSGSDARAMTMRAREAGDGWILDGTKRWISFGRVADLFLTFAAHGDGVSAFLVEAGAEGLEIAPITGMLGFRAAGLAELRFRECRVGGGSLLGRAGLGFGVVANHALDLGRFTVAWSSTGVARACLDASLSYAGSREQFGVRLGEHQLVRSLLADMWAEVEAGELLCAEAARLREDGAPESIMATAVAKYFGARTAVRVASDAVQIHGAVGCHDDHPLQRYYRDAKIFEIIEGSNQIQQLLIAHHALATGREGK